MAIDRTPRRPVAETVASAPATVIAEVPDTLLLSGDDLPFTGDGERHFTLKTSQVIGSGGQGVVVRAHDDAGNAYAAKLSLPAPSIRDRLAKRAVVDFLRSLTRTHPLGARHFHETHLMPIYAWGQASDTVDELGTTLYDVAVMPLCSDALAHRADVSFEEIRDVVLPQAACALRLLHERRIVHRDVKPKNLYELEGALVLGDFGISSVLDEGRDTSSTKIDRRTPGYSPHSSTVQCENDWYALGYTLWTLYNGGRHPHQMLIDQDDLSSVLAGQRPVAFEPKAPEHATLGELIMGLTYAHARGRLGYHDVARWLENPAGFSYHDPLGTAGAGGARGYQFEGALFRDNAALARALTENWERGKRHLYTQTLEDHFRLAGQNDLAVALNDLVEVHPSTKANHDLGLSRACSLIAGDTSTIFWKGRRFTLLEVGELLEGMIPAEALDLLSSGILSWNAFRTVGAASPLYDALVSLEADAATCPAFTRAYALCTLRPASDSEKQGSAEDEASAGAKAGKTGAARGATEAAGTAAGGASPAKAATELAVEGAHFAAPIGPDALLRTLTATPATFYRLIAQDKLMHLLLGKLAAGTAYEPCAALSRHVAENPMTDREDDAAPLASSAVLRERALRTLWLLEALGADSERLCALMRNWGPYGYVAWTASHTSLYTARTSEGRTLLDAVRHAGDAGAHGVDEANGKAARSASDASDAKGAGLSAAHDALAAGAALIDDLYLHSVESPYLHELGIADDDAHVEPVNADGYFTASFLGTAVPRGFALDMLRASSGDAEAHTWAKSAMVGANDRLFAGNAARAARSCAERLDDIAQSQAETATRQARGKWGNVAKIALSTLVVLALAVLWPQVTLMAWSVSTAGAIGPIDLTHIPAATFTVPAFYGFLAAAAVVIARRARTLTSISRSVGAEKRTHALAEGLREAAARIQAGNDPAERWSRYDDEGNVEQALRTSEHIARYGTKAERAAGDRDGLAFPYWAGAAVCALGMLLATVSGAPHAIIGESDLPFISGFDAATCQVVYVTAALTCFGAVAGARRAHPDMITLVLLCLAPVLLYIGAVLGAIALVVGIALFILYLIFGR